MEFFGSGGITLLVIAVAWLAFMTPSGQKSVKVAKKPRSRELKVVRSVQISQELPQMATTRVFIGDQGSKIEENTPEKLVINRLPDPLSARLGTIENVSWAPVLDLEKVRQEKENSSSESLDEILKRRRSIG